MLFRSRIVKDDPVRPHTPLEQRINDAAEILLLKAGEEVLAATCMQWLTDVPEDEQDLVDLLLILPVDVRILGVEYEHTEYTGKHEGMMRGIQPIFNQRDHSFSSSGLRNRVVEAESMKLLKKN